MGRALCVQVILSLQIQRDSFASNIIIYEGVLTSELSGSIPAGQYIEFSYHNSAAY